MNGGLHWVAGLLLGLVGSRLLVPWPDVVAPLRPGASHRLDSLTAFPLGADPWSAGGPALATPGDRPAAWAVIGAPRGDVQARRLEGRDVPVRAVAAVAPRTVVVHIHLASGPAGREPRPGDPPSHAVLAVEWTDPREAQLLEVGWRAGCDGAGDGGP